jgi:hypothetical protein
MKETMMKTPLNLRRSVFLACISISTAGLLAPSLTLADGKGASKLMFAASGPRTEAQVATVTPDKAMMNCSRCVDGHAQVVEKTGKGMPVESVKTVPVHLCPACQTRIVSVGFGKARTDQVIHSCASSGMSGRTCCVAGK